jgi:DNA-binding NtrC family response regulator
MNSAHREDILILIVDDEALLRELIADIFMDEGFRVVQADSAMGALKLLEIHDDIRLVFSDIQMPGKPDGLGLIEIVRQRWPHILLIVTSGRMRPKSEDLPRDTRFIQKPFDQSEMLRTVGDLLNL